MAIKLNKRAVEHAKKLIKFSEFERCDHNNTWAEDQATIDEEIYYMDNHSMEEFGLWFLGINDEAPANIKEHYEFPYGDFKEVHRCGLEVALKDAAKGKHKEIENAARELIALIDAQKRSE